MKNHLKVNNKTFLYLPNENLSERLFYLIDENRDYLNKWLAWVDSTKNKEDCFRFLKESRLFNNGGQKLTTFIHFEEEMVGSIGFQRIDKSNQIAELGYWLKESLQGTGIVTKSAKRLIEYTFSNMNINRIIIKVRNENDKSKAIPIRLGFKKEGVLREALYHSGRYHDVVLFSLLKSDFVEN